MSTPKIAPPQFMPTYEAAKKDGVIDHKELIKISKAAVGDHKIDDKEKAILGEIYESHVKTQGEYSTDELMDLPPQVQNLFQDMKMAKRPEVPKPVTPFKLVSDGPQSLDDPNLSPARKEMKQQLDKVVTTSRWGYQLKPEEVAAGKRNLMDGQAQMDNGTTCGLLPSSMIKHMGIQQSVISGSGTTAIETQGKRLGVWEDSDGSKFPKPGDLYTLRPEDSPNLQDGVAHVGVIYATGDGQFTTADAGQGGFASQEAGLVKRNLIYDAKGRPYLSGPANTPGDSAAFRRIGGWVDLDRLMFLQSYQDKLLSKPGMAKDKELVAEDVRQLATAAMRDGELNATEKKVFVEIAHHRGKLSEADIQSLPEPIRKIFEEEAAKPAPALIPLPGDTQDKTNPKIWHRRSSPIPGTGDASQHI